MTEAKKDKDKWQINRLAEKIEAFDKQNAMKLFQEDNDLFPTTKFFQDNKTEIFEMDAEGDKFEMFESMRIYVERFGRPYNYLKSVKYLNQKREEHLLEEESERNKKNANHNHDSCNH